MSDLLYRYVKGKGWVPEYKRPFPDHYNYDLICRNCGQRAGKHRANYTRNCPNGDYWNEFLTDSFWA